MIPKISVVVPCYNQGKFLSETLDSVLAQTLQEWECIVVDDGSTDNSSDIAKAYCTKDNRIRYVYQENAGPSAARNKGVSQTQAPLIYFLDGDDLIDVNLLDLGVKYMADNTNCKLYYTRAKCFGTINTELTLCYTSYKDLLVSNSIICASIIRRTDFERVGGFDEGLFGYEDWEFFIRLLYHNDTIYKEPQILFKYRCNGSPSSVNYQAKARNDEKTMYIYNKHIEKYAEYYGTPFHVTHEYNRLAKELDSILASKTYKVGKRILAPLAFVKRFLK